MIVFEIAGVVLACFALAAFTANMGTWYSWQYGRVDEPRFYDNRDYDHRDAPHGADCLIGMLLGLVWPLSLPIMIGNQIYRVCSIRSRRRWEAAQAQHKEEKVRASEIAKIADEINREVGFDDKRHR